MATPRVYADFQNLDDLNRLRLVCAGTLRDLQRQDIQLREGLVLTFYTDDADDFGRADELRVDGVVQYAQDANCWVAAVDWTDLRHASDEPPHDPRPSAALGPTSPDENRVTRR